MSLARELLLARIAAYRQQNFAYIYDSAHPDSFFRQLFPERDEYLAFAAEQLADRIQINSFEILREELSDNQARIIFYQQLQIGTNLQETVECGRLILEDGVWLYHSSQKLLLDEFAGDLKQITFADFDQAQDKIVF